MRVLAIDPGTTDSGFVLWDGKLIEGGMIDNNDLLTRIRGNHFPQHDICAIEMIASYGMPVGRETFETVLWIGRMLERSIMPVELIFRKDVKMHLCGTMKAKDSNIRQALIDKHGAPGTKKEPGGTYGISGHLWSALAIADYVIEKHSES